MSDVSYIPHGTLVLRIELFIYKIHFFSTCILYTIYFYIVHYVVLRIELFIYKIHFLIYIFI